MTKTIRSELLRRLTPDVQNSDVANKMDFLAAIVDEWEAIIPADTSPRDVERLVEELAPQEGIDAWNRAEEATTIRAMRAAGANRKTGA